MTSFRSKETLEEWVREFSSLNFPPFEDLRVLEQDGTSGDDTGLVAFRFRNAATSAYVQRSIADEPRWVMSLEPRPETIELEASEAASLSAEFSVAASLVAFLQAKSDAMEALI